jgi:hypothetical protein
MNPVMITGFACLLTFVLMGCNLVSDMVPAEFYSKVMPVNSPTPDQQEPDQNKYDKISLALEEEGTVLNPKQIISAQVLLISATGERIGGNTLITADNIETYRPSDRTVQIVSQYFKNHKFEVSLLTGISFTISASAKHFSEFFKASVTQDEKGRILACDRSELPLGSLEQNIADSIIAVTFVPSPDFGPTNFGF